MLQLPINIIYPPAILPEYLRHQEVAYVDDLIRKEAEEQELVPTTTMTTNTVEEKS